MKTAAATLLAVMALALGACRRSEEAGAGSPAKEVPGAVREGTAAALPEEAGREAGTGEEVFAEVAASAAAPEDCDVSTSEKAIEVFLRVTGDESQRPQLCVTPVPAFDAAQVGTIALEIGCLPRHVIRGCRVLDLVEAPRVILDEMGWASAAAEERERLAMLWTREMLHAGPQRGGGTVVEVEVRAFSQAGRTFTPPTAAARPDGGVGVTVWVSHDGGMGPRTIVLHEASFAPDGSVETAGKDSFEPAQGLRGGEQAGGTDGTVAFGPVQKADGSGAMDGDPFTAALDRKQAAIRACYRAALDNVPVGDIPGLRGDLTFVVTVSLQGGVTVEAEGDSEVLNGAGVTSCVLGRLRGMSFASSPPEGGAFVARLPVSFSPP